MLFEQGEKSFHTSALCPLPSALTSPFPSNYIFPLSKEKQ